MEKGFGDCEGHFFKVLFAFHAPIIQPHMESGFCSEINLFQSGTAWARESINVEAMPYAGVGGWCRPKICNAISHL